ncbi:hypothetical protein R3P38DRAFT_1884979 [Favolaschia claudopus]|uniref:Secreted protein n=1 Tax=Favolaschia claudopus TaxID=2862362 RepID=A0AAW0DFM0_9AGAR
MGYKGALTTLILVMGLPPTSHLPPFALPHYQQLILIQKSIQLGFKYPLFPFYSFNLTLSPFNSAFGFFRLSPVFGFVVHLPCRLLCHSLKYFPLYSNPPPH